MRTEAATPFSYRFTYRRALCLSAAVLIGMSSNARIAAAQGAAGARDGAVMNDSGTITARSQGPMAM